MKVGTGGNLGLSREYHKKLFGPLFYTWWNCPLSSAKQYILSRFPVQVTGVSLSGLTICGRPAH